MRKLKWTVTLILLVAVMIFAVENAAVVEYSFLGNVIEVRRAAVVTGSMLIGIFLGWLLGSKRRR